MEKVVLNIEEVIPEILRTGIDEIDAKYKVVEQNEFALPGFNLGFNEDEGEQKKLNKTKKLRDFTK